MAHVFFVVMGGFVGEARSGRFVKLWHDEFDWAVLCVPDGSMAPKSAVASGINDHSKAGAVAKALLCWQLLVFVVSCAARRAERLPLSLLEITTLAHSLCALAAFALWWHKPHSVDEVVTVPVTEDPADDVDEGWRIDFTGPSVPPSALQGANVILDLSEEGVPTTAILTSLAVAVLYGLPHLFALSTDFPSLAERRCWQVATGIIIGAPLTIVALCKLLTTKRWEGTTDVIVFASFAVLVVVYPLASCFVVAESFRQLFALPSGTFLAPALVCYLPHFS